MLQDVLSLFRKCVLQQLSVFSCPTSLIEPDYKCGLNLWGSISLVNLKQECSVFRRRLTLYLINPSVSPGSFSVYITVLMHLTLPVLLFSSHRRFCTVSLWQSAKMISLLYQNPTPGLRVGFWCSVYGWIRQYWNHEIKTPNDENGLMGCAVSPPAEEGAWIE